MNKLKRYLGIIWLLLGPVTIIILLTGAIQNVSEGGTGDIHRPLPWIP
jgi:ABC-type polysaccharide/polyol phosphate export permease